MSPGWWIRKSYNSFLQCLDARNPWTSTKWFTCSLGVRDKITGIKVFSHNFKFVKDKSSYYFHRNLTLSLILTLLNISCILHRLRLSDKAIRYLSFAYCLVSVSMHFSLFLLYCIMSIFQEVNQQLKSSSLKYKSMKKQMLQFSIML